MTHSNSKLLHSSIQATCILSQDKIKFIQANETLQIALKQYMEARKMKQAGLIGNVSTQRERLRLIYRILKN